MTSYTPLDARLISSQLKNIQLVIEGSLISTLLTKNDVWQYQKRRSFPHTLLTKDVINYAVYTIPKSRKMVGQIQIETRSHMGMSISAFSLLQLILLPTIPISTLSLISSQKQGDVIIESFEECSLHWLGKFFVILWHSNFAFTTMHTIY